MISNQQQLSAGAGEAQSSFAPVWSIGPAQRLDHYGGITSSPQGSVELFTHPQSQEGSLCTVTLHSLQKVDFVSAV